jgi:uridine kinase/8-oxo-dGTP pyrophosphatase MutT (NUDIX family)
MEKYRPRIIEFSGVDYSGKTTQANLSSIETQKYHVVNFGSFAKYFDKKINNLSAHDNFDWWFRESNYEELVDHLVRCYLKRYYDAKKFNIDIVIFERGISMIKAQIAANFASRENNNVDNHIEKASNIIDKKITMCDRNEKKEIFLELNEKWVKSQRRYTEFTRNVKSESINYSKEESEFYALYIHNLTKALRHYSDKNDAIVIDVDSPAVDIQNKIRANQQIFPSDMPKLLINDPILLGLAGLSESGKSTVAEYLKNHHDFTRVKLGYFNETLRRNNDKYANSLQVGLNLVHFIATNRHLNRISFESIHEPTIHSEMKLLVGERWKAVFINLDKTKRRERLLAQNNGGGHYTEILLKLQREKDARKHAAGIEKLKQVADFIADNSDSIELTAKTIMNCIIQKVDMEKNSSRNNKKECLDASKIIKSILAHEIILQEEKVKPDRCRAIIFNNNGTKILGILRQKQNQTPYVVIPGGGMEKGDKNELDTIWRELNEELKLTKNDITLNDTPLTLNDEFGKQNYYFGIAKREFSKLTIGGPEKESDQNINGKYLPQWFEIASLESINLVPKSIKDLIIKYQKSNQ